MIDSVLFNLHMMTNGRLNEWRKFPTVKELFEDYLSRMDSRDISFHHIRPYVCALQEFI